MVISLKLLCYWQGRPQEILQGGGVSSFQPTDERACNDNLLDMEACKISDGGKLNSGTAAEPFF
jgi:hypothetical protein